MKIDHFGFEPFATPPLQQHPAYLDCVTALGGTGQVVTLHDGAAKAQLLRRRIGPVTVNWIPRGPLYRTGLSRDQKNVINSDLTASLPKALITLIAPESEDDAAILRRARFRAIMTPQTIAELTLSIPTETRLAQQHGKWRNRLRHAQAQGLIISDTPFDPDRDAQVFALETELKRHHRYRALPHSFTSQWAQQGTHATRLFTARDHTGLLAYMLFLLHAPTATYHMGWNSAAGRTASAHNLLLWTASCWLADRGYARLDLGTVDTDTAPGLARFKIGSGATIRRLGPTMMRLC